MQCTQTSSDQRDMPVLGSVSEYPRLAHWLENTCDKRLDTAEPPPQMTAITPSHRCTVQLQRSIGTLHLHTEVAVGGPCDQGTTAQGRSMASRCSPACAVLYGTTVTHQPRSAKRCHSPKACFEACSAAVLVGREQIAHPGGLPSVV